MIWGLLAIFMTLIPVVGIHEAGHALVARFFQIKIQKISIGLGQALIHWQRLGSFEWVLGAWPLGGYVQLQNSRITPLAPDAYPFCFDKKPISARICVLLAGPLANMLFSIMLLVMVCSIGLSHRMPQVQSVQNQSIGARAGIEAGDEFVFVDGYATHSWQDVGMELIFSWGKKEVPVVLLKSNHELKTITLNLSQVSFKGPVHSLLQVIGIQPNKNATQAVIRDASLLKAVKHALTLIVHQGYFLFVVLKHLVAGVIPFSMLLGPIGLFALSINSLIQGVVAFLFFIATLSLAVGLINLLPFPGLDGGSILYCVIESIRKKPLSLAMEVLLYRFMLIILFLVLVQLLKNDIFRLLL